MNVENGKTVEIEYSTSLESGEVIDTNVGKQPVSFVHGSQQIFQALEDNLAGMAAGDVKKIVLTPEMAYGPVNPEALVTLPIERLPENLREAGALVQSQTPQGETIKGQVKEVDEQKALVDFNHPLAGINLHFEIKILSVRDSGN